jgi:hypothetical protein
MQHFAGGARPSISGPVYLSIDLDGLDPAFAPGVSHREPGGLSVRDVLQMIHGLGGPIVGADVVEFNPSQDLGNLTASVAAKSSARLPEAFCCSADAIAAGADGALLPNAVSSFARLLRLGKS